MNRTEFPGGGFWLLRRQGSLLKGRVEARFGFGRRNVADGLEQAAVVKTAGPRQDSLLEPGLR
jgi:hypothetical protein